MFWYASWTIKKAEWQRIYAFKLWCWRRLLRIPWTARRSNQSIQKKINLQYSLEGLTLKLKFQYFGQVMWRGNTLEKTWFWERLKAGGEGDDRGWDGWMASPTQWAWVWAKSRRWWRTGKPGVLQSMGSQRVGHNLVTEQQHSTLRLHRRRLYSLNKESKVRGEIVIFGIKYLFTSKNTNLAHCVHNLYLGF